MNIRQIGILALTIGMVAVSACNGDPKAGASLAPGVPAGAIHVKGDLYMVPLDKKGGQCAMYRAHAAAGAAVTAIFYRTAKGEFVMDKSLAGCP